MQTPVVIEVTKRPRALQAAASDVFVPYRRRHPAGPNKNDERESEADSPAWGTALARRPQSRRPARP